MIYLVILTTAFTGASVFSQEIRINEVMSSNQKSFYDEDLDTPDWIELYNSSNTLVNLAGYGLSDDLSKPYKWTFPGIILNPGEFLVIAASGKDRKAIPLYWETVISVNDTFRYWIPTEDPGIWQSRLFNDGNWRSGRSGFGYGDGDDATLVPDGTLTVLARRNFTVNDLSVIKKLALHVDFDDSFVAYLNGHEIARSQIGNPGIPPPWNMPAANSNHEATLYRHGTPDAFQCDSALKYLVQGTNVLAIEVHNQSRESNDLSCIPYLSLGFIKKPISSKGTPSSLVMGNTYLHVNFRINAAGDTIVLTSPAGAQIDSMVTGVIPADISLGYKPDDQSSVWFFDSPTPGTHNLSQAYPVAGVLDPVFSHKGGFITDSIELRISGSEAGDTIWYTTDGSTPKPGANRYTNPVIIGESTVVRAIITGPGRMNRKAVSRSYLMRPEKPTLVTVSLTTDPENLFDRDTGIYVTGPHASPDPPYDGANYWQDWERPVHIEVYDTNGTLGMEADAGMKIYGTMSRTFPQKSLAFYTRGKYGDKLFRYPLFPDLPFTEYNNFVLRNSGNDWNYTMFRDALMCSLLDQSGIDRLAYRPASVYINGEYWGLLNIREKINEHYLAAHYHVDPYQIDLLEYRHTSIHGDAEHYDRMIRFLEYNSPEIEANYDSVKTMMDVVNFMEYQIAEIYFDNYDWPGVNIKFWRPRIQEGKWRWIIFDTDVGFGLYSDAAYADNSMAFATAANGRDYPNPPWSTFLLRRLLENEAFRNEFINRFADRLNTDFSYQTVLQRIDKMSNAIAGEIPYHSKRWHMWENNLGEWYSNVEKLRIFAGNRVSYMRKFISGQFSDPDTATLRVTTSSTQSGSIRLSTLELNSFPWEGVYFEGVPVPVSAYPNEGYRFVRWEGPVSDPLSSSTIVNLNGFTSVKAVFQQDIPVKTDVIINEIYYHDISGFDAGDWIELYNPGNTVADLSGWILVDDDPADQYIIPNGTYLYPKDYLILCKDIVKFALAYPETNQAVGDFFFGLGITGECITLLNANKTIIDAVCYGVSDPWPSSPVSNGVSLELIQPGYDNSLGANWQGSYIRHGTPGSVNSVYIPPVTSEIEHTGTGLTLECSPNPFSLLTRIRFEVPDRERIRLSVYDMKGNLVRILYEGESEAGVHEIIWDGNDSNDIRTGPGIYICVLETGSKVERCRLVII